MLNIFKMAKDFISWRKIISSSENYISFLKQQGVRVGENVMIYGLDSITFDLTRPWLVKIGNNVEITTGATILTHGYDWCVAHKLYGEIMGSVGMVQIDDNVFVGMNSTLLPGTHIHENTIIAAGSVVKGELQANSVYGGVPAKRISSIADYFAKRRALQLQEATQLVNEYKKVYGKTPPVEDLHEHFWLFENQLEGLNQTFLDKLALRGNFEQSAQWFTNRQPMFANYEEFLQYCETQSVE